MARNLLLISLLCSAFVLVGCFEQNTQKRFMAEPAGPVKVDKMFGSASTEVALVENLAASRADYKSNLEILKSYYKQTGNDTKLQWAKKELAAVNTAPKYRYILEAEVAGPNLKAQKAIEQADALYNKAMADYRKAKALVIIVDDRQMVKALNKFNQLISEFPQSDKIDDAAFWAGKIYEHFKDYTIAVLYYKRTYQWDEDTAYPAYFRSAYITDKYLRQRAAALELYKIVLEKEARYEHYKIYAQSE